MGLLKALTKTVVETGLDEEMIEHLGYDKHAPEGRNRENSRNGKRSKTIVTQAAGQVRIEVPRDRDAHVQPAVVKKRQRRLSDLDAVVIWVVCQGAEHWADLGGTSPRSTAPRLSKDTVSRITDRVIERTCRPGRRGRCWASTRRSSSTRSTSKSETARSGTSRSTHPSGSTCEAAATCSVCGPATVVGSRRSSPMSVVTDLKNRGIGDVFFVVCGGL